MNESLKDTLRHGNFRFIRLVAAIEVAISHALRHFGFEPHALFAFFPGVPVFFFLSGFFVCLSYRSLADQPNRNLIFFKRRALRIFPALWLAVLLSLSVVATLGAELNFIDSLIYLLLAGSFINFYSPDFFNSFGVGVVNGSLWSVSVELQFYILVPVMWFIVTNLRYALLFVIVFLLCIFNFLFWRIDDESLVKILYVSFIPWWYMFFLGFIFCYFDGLRNTILKKIHFSLLIVVYTFIYQVCLHSGQSWGNAIPISGFLLLALLILKLGMIPFRMDSFLCRVDLSYGIYIYHMLFVNFLLSVDVSGTTGIALALMGTLVFSFFSWFFIESVALRFK
jgi:peptidoglycan/LPS O-acetylase OafA/YrhL